MRYLVVPVTVLLCASCVSAPDPFLFAPTIAPDGARTWMLRMSMKDIPKEDRELPRKQRDEKLAGYMIAWKQFCDKGWEITDSREDQEKLTIEGRCT